MSVPSRRSVLGGAAALGSALLVRPALVRAASLSEIRIDFAFYNPLSLVIRSQKLLEREFEADHTAIRWVQSLGSNKALEFLNAGSIDFGSTSGAAALIGRVNGNPVRAVAVTSKPEWTALVTLGNSGLNGPADLKGKSVAVTRGTDPHVFLIRALDRVGLSERDVKLVLLQHPDGKTALIRGDVDAWAGLDPLMAQAEIENGARLIYRNPDFNSLGILNTREEFALQNPAAVRRVLKVYEDARRWALANPGPFRAILTAETKLSDAVLARQLDRTDLSSAALGGPQRDVIVEAGLALQKAGVLAPSVDVAAAANALVDAELSGRGG